MPWSHYWNTVEGVRALGDKVQYTAIVLAVLATLLGFVKQLAVVRERELNSQITTKKDAAFNELQQRSAPRRIADAQRGPLLEALTNARSKGPVRIACVLGDGEGLAFAAQLKEILTAAGWAATGVDQGAYDENPVGLLIEVPSAKKAPPHAGALQLALRKGGLAEAQGIEGQSLSGESVVLIVGNKPR